MDALARQEGAVRANSKGRWVPLTETGVEFNDMAADRYAKAAVETHRVPYRIRMAVAAHDKLTTHNAMWIARATVIANQQPADPGRDTPASRAKAAEAAATKRRIKAAAAARLRLRSPRRREPVWPPHSTHNRPKPHRRWSYPGGY